MTNEAGNRLEPEEIFKMNYLAGNVVGGIPKLSELKEEVKEFVRLQGDSDENIIIGRCGM